jgi:acyl-CoA synthetase (AMP-forming)/AMP-acid ligase II
MAGVIAVPLDARQTPDQWAYVINDAQVKLLFCAHEFAPAIDDIRAEIPSVELFVDMDNKHIEGDWKTFDAFMGSTAPLPIERTVTEHDPFYMICTSGTTGAPKGVVHSHGAINAYLRQNDLICRARPGERWLMVTPIFHTSAISHIALLGTYTGGTVQIMKSFDPVGVVRALSEDHIAGISMGAPMIGMCLNNVPDVAQHQYDSLRLITYGGAPIAPDTLSKATDVFGCDFLQVYGLTESSFVTFLTPNDHRRALQGDSELLMSAGRPVPGCDVRIVDVSGSSLPTGETGEIVVRGPQVMIGYWERPEATAEALKDGWLHTGDVGRLDDAGYLFLQDRKKDVIVTLGRNVYPAMVENVLIQHPAVTASAVIGVPDPETGEAVKAVVVLNGDESATEAELLAFCDGKLGEHQRPLSVDFVDALPRNAMGKILKRVLREPYWQGHERQIGGV